MKKLALFIALLPFFSCTPEKGGTNDDNLFPIVSKSVTATIYYDNTEEPLLRRSARFLASDIERVSGKEPAITSAADSLTSSSIIIGTLGNNLLIDKLIADGKLNVDPIRGKWEGYIIETIKDPFPDVNQALIIVGSDRRGAAYAVFTLSEEMGVSPWYWWADVPVEKSKEILHENGRIVCDGPAVKYRGIFINDEAPALRTWAEETFGGFNHEFYEKVFELILRNKGNYLWPAMWTPSMFNEDDTLNPVLADEYGIVISTTHHEPMMRAHQEWYAFNGGEWNYERNKEKLQEFWRGGIERMGVRENIVTVGMRGDGDEAMSEETAVGLMKTIIADQREIIEDVTGKPAEETPQVWAVYKEVQDYYDKGMRVDDDIMVLFCDDNWGNLRILPKKEDLDHKGGYGIYYHFDFVGGPVSYRWLNVSQIERIWEQMNLAYQWGVQDLWLVNVGDIKPMELPISFFLDFAWDPNAIQAKDLPAYYVNWAEQQFGAEHSTEIADLLALYTKYNARRTPEMLKPDTYSLFNYREADRIVEEYSKLLERSSKIYERLPECYQSAYFQLVHSPIELCCNLNEMYVAAGKNNVYERQGRASTNAYADSVKELFDKDAELTREFHEELEGGKWKHMMSQTHIGYTSWNNPRVNKMPAVSYIHPSSNTVLGYVVEHGIDPAWGGFGGRAGGGLFSPAFAEFDPINQQSYYLEIFNGSLGPLEYSLECQEDWIVLSKTRGNIQYDEKVIVSIDWDKAPKGKYSGEIIIKGGDRDFTVEVPIRNDLPEAAGFVENNGVIAIEAPHFTQKSDAEDCHWTVVPNMGRTGSSLIIEPSNAPRQDPEKGAPVVEYTFTVFDPGELSVESYLSPTQNYQKTEGLLFAVAIDDEKPQIVNLNEGEIKPDWTYPDWWNQSVGDHIKIRRTKHQVSEPGVHTLKIWAIDPGVVFQRFVIDAGGLKPSYLGPSESVYISK